ncbi:Cd2+/Zn2+-exporting ATPase [Lentibacillus halodurans]|uniref:Cd(2+)-exporting ATPase n=1 Tax=Lentibacillus halodurans TaxID=237679 RepID=A0A1I0XVW7_9BACI|nr:Cd2+/Zn2+-exporting ATPase [Lentibacillus halodurans]
MSSEHYTYRLNGISCANCAQTFENNVKEIDGVEDANVHFAASKIDVFGKASINDIEKAGSFENIKVIQEHTELEKEPFWVRYDNVLLAALLLVFGFISNYTFGNAHYLPKVLYGLSALIGGLTLFKAGFINLAKFRFDMKTLMTIAVVGATVIGEWREAAIVVILFAISEALESYSMDKARLSIRSLMNISPNIARVRRNGNEQTIAVEDVVVGDVMLVKPGERIAMDGTVIDGSSSINQAPITGESIPAEKTTDDDVFAGTINQDGFLEIVVTKKVEDTTIAKIIHMVEEAQDERAPAQQFIDRFAAYYTPAIIVIALLVAIVPSLFGGAWGTWVYQGLAVLVVGCPCALVVSTPVAIVTAIGNAARSGVLIKGGIHLEQIGTIQKIAFDKTGTLTKGTPKVTDIHFFTEERNKALSYLKALEAKSNHPLAKAIMDYLNHEQSDITAADIQSFTTIHGKGIRGEIDGEYVYAGSADIFKDDVPDSQMKYYQEAGKTVMLCGTDDEYLLAVALRDEPRTESRDVIKKLHDLGIQKTFMLTGDHEQTAKALKDDLALTDVKANLLPEDKLQFIKAQENDSIAMIGDGINDTPALAASKVGIAMGSAGTDSALETADVALMGDDLNKLPYTVKLSRKALGIIKQNISLAISIKVLALLLVIPGWLTLWIAIFADMGATLLVTFNALRLLKTN